MYIISKRKDYYDGVAGTTGIDKTIVYNRQIVEVDDRDLLKPFQNYNPFSNKNPSPFRKLTGVYVKHELRAAGLYDHAVPFIIGFCGKLYIGWKLYSIVKKEKYPYDNELITTITYDNDNIKNLVYSYGWNGNLEDNINYILTYNPIEFFRALHTPVFVFDGDYKRTYISTNTNRWDNNDKFFINPLLKEYQFYKVFNAVQAFQEIQMFLGGVLGKGEKEIIEVADKYKIGQHGFDKWSFRKMPEDGKV